jgi:pyridoxal/pyridoxine/pyridoxamine kinase
VRCCCCPKGHITHLSFSRLFPIADVITPNIPEAEVILDSQIKNSSDATSYVDSTCKVAGSAIEGFSIVYDSLEEAAKQLGRNFTEQSVTVVSHK